MNMQIADRINHAVDGMVQAAELMWKAAQLKADIEGMVATNQDRLSNGKSIAYDENAFLQAKDSYK